MKLTVAFLFLIYMCLALLLISFISRDLHASSCNQEIYNQIYESIIQNTLAGPVNRETLTDRNYSIEMLRTLCKGQKSKWEEPDEDQSTRQNKGASRDIGSRGSRTKHANRGGRW